MKTLLITAIALTFILTVSVNTYGCGYGLLDPDVEQFCTGDANQAREALARLEKKGMSGLQAISSYRLRSERSHKSYTNYLIQLQTDPAKLDRKNAVYYKEMDDQTREREIKRAETFLQWNVKRLERVRFLEQHIKGFGFAGESLQFGKATLS